MFELDEKKVVQTNDEKKYIVSFQDALIYNMNTHGVSSIINSKHMLKFRDYDEMFDVNITIQSNKKQSAEIDFINTKHAIYTKGVLDMSKYVQVIKKDEFILTSKELTYDSEKKILKNKTDFKIKYSDDTILNGSSLMLDLISDIAKADNIHYVSRQP
jgi:hypothetical protein